MTKAVDNVNDVIAEALIGLEATRQVEIDEMLIRLDGTPNKGKIRRQRYFGRLHGCSQGCRCFCRVAAVSVSGAVFPAQELPVPMMNILTAASMLIITSIFRNL